METKPVLKSLEDARLAGVEASKLEGFEKAFAVSDAIVKIEKALNSEYMKPILKMAGSRLGFKTDKDSTGGYDERTIKRCLIEAVLIGVNPVDNQFNIIANNCYITKEGFGYLLKKVEGLKYTIKPGLPHINKENTSAAIDMVINWEFKSIKSEETLKFAVKINKYMGIDGVIGKATRKARKWLFEVITGSEMADGEVEEIPYIEVTNDEKATNELTPDSSQWKAIKESINKNQVTLSQIRKRYSLSAENETILLQK